jgi:hypothetical protein
MVVSRSSHFSVLLPDGRVLIGGGWLDDAKQTTEIYDPWTNTFSMGLSPLQPRETSLACLF